jgi:hypothetical protein
VRLYEEKKSCNVTSMSLCAVGTLTMVCRRGCYIEKSLLRNKAAASTRDDERGTTEDGVVENGHLHHRALLFSLFRSNTHSSVTLRQNCNTCQSAALKLFEKQKEGQVVSVSRDFMQSKQSNRGAVASASSGTNEMRF